MAAEEKFDSYADRAAIKAETDYIIEQLQRVNAMFDKLNEFTVTLNGVKTFKEFTEVTREVKKETDELGKIETAIIKTYEKRQAATSNQAKALAEEKVALQQKNKELKLSAQLQQAEIGSIDEARAKLQLLRELRDKQNLNTDAGKQRRDELNKEIDLLDEFIEKNTDAYTKRKINIGNYAESLSPLFDKLSQEMERLKQEQKGLQDMSKRDPIGFQIGGGQERLTQVNAQLQQYNELQQVGFRTAGSYTQQIKNLENAYDGLVRSGDHSVEFLEQFRKSLEDAKRSAKFNSSDFSGAYAVLKKELDEIRKKLKDPALTGGQLEQLQQEEKLLTVLTESLNQAFTSTRQEMRAMQEAAKTLGINFGTDSEIFMQFTQQVGEAKDSLDDIQGIINRQSSDTKFLDSAVASVNALAGAYGAAQGAQELFGDGSDNMQRTMVKLQALMTIINGLQAIQNALQAESGVIQTILAGKLQLVNAAKAVEAKLFAVTAAAAQAEAIATGESALAAQAAAVANTENAVANQAAAVAQGEAALAAGATTVALEGEAVAAATATKATVTLRTALLASGIGALLVAIGVAIVYLIKKTNEWVSSNERALEKQNKLAETIKKTNDAVIEQANLLQSKDATYKRYLESQLSLVEGSGASMEKQFGLRKKIFEEDKRLAQQQIDQLGATNGQQAALLTQIENYRNRQVFELERLQKAVQEGDKEQQEASQKVLDFYDGQIQKATSLYQAGETARQQLFTANQNLNQATIEEAKFTADEQRKLVLESVNIEVDAVQSKNEQILSSERSTLSERVKALRSNLEAQKALINAQKNDVLNNPASTVVDKTLAIKRAAQEQIKATRETNRAIAVEQEREQLRNLQAYQEVLEQKKQLEIDLNKDIASNQVFSLEERLAAQKKYMAAQKELIDAEYKFRLQQAGISEEEIAALEQNKDYKVKSKKITDAELFALQKDHETQVLRLALETNTSITEILKDELDKQTDIREEHLADIERFYNQLSAFSGNQYAGEIIALNESFAKGTLSYSAYLKKREKLDKDYQRKAAQDLVQFLEAQLTLFEGAEQKQAEAKKKVEDLKKSYIAGATDAEKKAIGEKIDLAQEELDKATEVVDKKIALENKLADAKIEASDRATEKAKEDGEKWEQVYEQVAMSALDVIAAFTSGDFERQNQKLQEQLDLLDKKTQKQIDTIKQTVGNEKEAEKQIAEVEARANARRDALERQQRANQMRQARFERDVQALKILGETLFQAAKLGWITPAAIAVEVAGAASIAMLYAKPLPKYFKGKPKGDNYEGFAWVGDGRKSELILREDGSMEVTPDRDTLTYVGKNDVILPDAKAALQDAERYGIPIPRVQKETAQEEHWRLLSNEMRGMRKDIVHSIKNIPQPVIQTVHPLKTIVHGHGSQTKISA